MPWNDFSKWLKITLWDVCSATREAKGEGRGLRIEGSITMSTVEKVQDKLMTKRGNMGHAQIVYFAFYPHK